MRNGIRKGRTAATVKAKHTSVASTSRETKPSSRSLKTPASRLMKLKKLYHLLEGQISTLEAQVTPAEGEVSHCATAHTRRPGLGLRDWKRSQR
eukprot:37670-Prorocentrum_minimum.AAC.1